ncbi:putative E3 ubiquitin-protein ligase UBR7 [Ricinus communis]|uniref:Protein binding protein, putative n=1 Tax=Ricinus communis TaxID=3988 RepID=B9RCS8_RICCO|nr:putative E3 ubiquitin-protein ligase UBR7 [Ricinus communis]EEF51349.1 protein binding protein, putative [Ricinus communis]|eukprot:XP_002509962.1 putative E3 ubiquitin-protein ligase UBR7 [Ricinus communis]
MDGAFEDDNEQSITIDEYLNKVEAEELEADLVLGGDEGKECTYTTGYMKRQAIFSCLTCTPDGNAGVCTACSLSCHDGHEIVELWTKRNFRCDCGNSKFGENFCKLFPQKDLENGKNSYNHNFKGSYCSCGRPYPDPDVEEQEEMIQCIMCEDWFHEEHLGLESSDEIPRDEEGEPLYEDFICKTCSATCSFLTLYPQTIWAAGGQSGDVTANTSKDKNVLEDIPSACGSGKLENDACSHGSGEDIMANANCGSISVAKTSLIGESSEKNIDSNQSTKDANLQTPCVLGVDTVATFPVLESKPLFLAKNWRDTLCRCDKCLDMYSQNHASYFLDKEDSIAEYEKMAKEKREEKLQKQEGAELSFFNKLGHIEKMEILSGIADFKEEFRTFLESFDTSKTITSSDVHQIFENLAKKRRRME